MDYPKRCSLRFFNSYIMHKPHPSNIIKGYVMRQVFRFLKANGYINK